MTKAQKPIVSVIVPFRDAEAYLQRCIDSILASTWKEIELILVDDGSTDQSSQIAAEAATDPRVRLAGSGSVGGTFAARATGASMANGDYLMFVDSDDHIGTEYIEQMVLAAIDSQADIVKSRFVFEDEESGFRFTLNKLWEGAPQTLRGSEILDAYFAQRGMNMTWNIVWGHLFTRSLWEQGQEFYRSVTEPLVFWDDVTAKMPLFVNAKLMKQIDVDTYFYVARSNSVSGPETDYEKCARNIRAVSKGLRYCDQYLQEKGLLEKYSEESHILKQHLGHSLKRFTLNGGLSKQEQISLEMAIKDALGLTEFIEADQEQDAIYSEVTPWQ